MAFAPAPNLAFYDDLARELALRKLTVTDVHALFLNAAQMFSARARRDVLSVEGQVTRMLGAGFWSSIPRTFWTTRNGSICMWPTRHEAAAGGGHGACHPRAAERRRADCAGKRPALARYARDERRRGDGAAGRGARLPRDVGRAARPGPSQPRPVAGARWATGSSCCTCTTRSAASSIIRRLRSIGGRSSRSSSARRRRSV